ncbi:hypothetical protein Psed_6696 (plasmid) [Pseudonocardia dioxanivorans CB1190]|uniref:Uncharacterized protein n=1 Tax=Pseudonocardia dioxanivorans (strain ATCC 55486 / DSM 44775 / JCM 13855 / CB1190) TaxID=675635 RepID=F2L6R1_PSEUX|nr:hypothetical protein [Pseudonocardia dioxanivorans]AEA28783.1 hypothetical protein Psed_6696 [Pseudonocardia dioxanivorans CB1190]GJF05075.1 hypothetical protein PSD17_40280 [Pseudonocardia sp. D17]
MASLEDQESTLELINKEIADALTRQTSARSQVDTKAALVAGVAATATQFLAGGSHPAPLKVLAVLAYVADGLSFAAAVAAFAVAKFNDVPEPRVLVKMTGSSKARTLAHLAATRAKVYEKNQDKAHRKVIFWWFAVGALALGLCLSSFALALTPLAAPTSIPVKLAP